MPRRVIIVVSVLAGNCTLSVFEPVAYGMYVTADGN
jgi:hypothetical protein